MRVRAVRTASERLPSEEFLPSLFDCDFGVGENERVDFPRLLSSWKKLHASPFVHFPFAFH